MEMGIVNAETEILKCLKFFTWIIDGTGLSVNVSNPWKLWKEKQRKWKFLKSMTSNIYKNETSLTYNFYTRMSLQQSKIFLTLFGGVVHHKNL